MTPAEFQAALAKTEFRWRVCAEINDDHIYDLRYSSEREDVVQIVLEAIERLMDDKS